MDPAVRAKALQIARYLEWMVGDDVTLLTSRFTVDQLIEIFQGLAEIDDLSYRLAAIHVWTTLLEMNVHSVRGERKH